MSVTADSLPLVEVGVPEALRQARLARATDIHLIGGQPVRARLGRHIEQLGKFVLASNAVTEYLEARKRQGDDVTDASVSRIGSADFAATDDKGAIRVHVYKEQRGIRLAIRMLGDRPPAFASLGLPDAIKAFTERSSGLVLITGPKGSGKSSLAHSLIDLINAGGGRSIIMIEKPIEYRHEEKNSLIAQQEVGQQNNVPSFAQGVVAAMNADADVIMIGQITSEDEAQAALSAAEMGCLVIATLHARNMSQAIERFPSWFTTGQQRARLQLAQTLIGGVNLRLLERLGGEPGSIVPAFEIMIMDDTLRSLVREGKVDQVRQQIFQGRSKGMCTLEQTLNELVAQRRIRIDDARRQAVFPEDIKG